MSDLLESLKQKYSDEIGWSFSFFEGMTFVIYLVASRYMLDETHGGLWKALINKSAYSIFIGDTSILVTARVIDYAIAAFFTIATVHVYGVLKRRAYDYLSSLKDLDSYVERLKTRFFRMDMENQAMRIYMANEAKEQKQVYMKQITTLNGSGLIALCAAISGIFGLSTPNIVDFTFLVGGLASLLLIQWHVFAKYTAQVVPRLILERIARGEDFQFGDELDK